MAQRCKVCDHPKLKEINMRLVEGTTAASTIAKEMGVTNESMHNHKTHHLPKLLVRGLERTRAKMNHQLVKKSEEVESIQLADSFDLIGKIDFLLTETKDIYNIARKGGQNLLALKSLDSLRNHYQLLINISAQLHANKLLELQLLKEQQGDDNEGKKLEHERKIQVLSFEELKMLSRIQDKINNQTDELLILDGKVFGWDEPLKFD